MKNSKSKVTITVWRPVWSKLEKQLESACLKRDAYVDALIDHELDHLDAEMAIANSDDAQRFIDKQLRALINANATPLSLALSSETLRKLEGICKRKKVVRDAFFNRLFLFIAFGPDMAWKLFFRNTWMGHDKPKPSDWTRMVWEECKHDGPFFENVFDPFAAHLDPIWPIRACFDVIEAQDKPAYVNFTDPKTKQTVKMVRWVPEDLLYLPPRFYTSVLTDHDLLKAPSARPGQPQQRKVQQAFHNLYGLNCYLPNFHIPGHPEQTVAQAAMDQLLADL